MYSGRRATSRANMARAVSNVFSGNKPYVVDVNSFPGFKGVPDAALRLADYIFSAAQRQLEQQKPRPVRHLQEVKS